MSHEAILDKAIQKAIGNGWDFFGWWGNNMRYEVGDWSDGTVDITLYQDYGGTTGEVMDWHGESPCVIFNHDFAKALFGEGIPSNRVWADNNFEYVPAWKTHLQKMVLADDPIEYLGKHLPSELSTS